VSPEMNALASDSQRPAGLIVWNWPDLPVGLRLLVAFLLISVLPMATMMRLALDRFEQSVRETALDGLAGVADKKADQIDVFIVERREDTAVLSRDLRLRAALQSLGVTADMRAGARHAPAPLLEQRYREELLGLVDVGRYHDLLLIDPVGNVVLSLRHEADHGTNLISGPYSGSLLAGGFRQAISDLQVNFTAFEPYAPSGFVPAAFLVAPVLEGARLLGAVALQINLDQLTPVLQDRTGLGRSGETVLARREGDYLRYTGPLQRSGMDAAFRLRRALVDVDAPMRNALDGRRARGTGLDHAGVEVVAVSRYLPALGWGMVVKVDAEEALALVGQARALAAWTLAGFLLLAAALAYVFGRGVTRPLTALTRMNEALARGEFELLPTSAFRRSGREFQQLGRAFNRMMTEVRLSRQDLTDRVRERTAELERLSTLQSTILDYAGYAILTTDVEGRITLFNRAAERLFGMRADEVLGHSLPWQWFEPHQALERSARWGTQYGVGLVAGFDTLVAPARHGAGGQHEWQLRGAQGQEFPARVAVSALPGVAPDSDGSSDSHEPGGFVLVIDDLSDRRRAEQSLRVQRTLYRAVFEGMSDGVAIYEAEDEGADFVFRDFNAAAERITHTSRVEVLGRRVTVVFPGVLASGLLEQFRHVWRSGEAVTFSDMQYQDERMGPRRWSRARRWC